MDGKFFDIPFLPLSALSDFACKDGEIASFSGCIMTDRSAIYPPSGDQPSSGLLQELLGERPPAPEVTFALSRAVLPGWHINYDAYPLKHMNCSSPSAENWGEIATELLDRFETEALGQNLFTSPFLVMAAWRLKNGALLSPSSPVVMVPNSTFPLVSTAGSIDSSSLDLRVIAALCSLFWKISLPEKLREWVGKIEGIEILLSRQQKFYDPSRKFLYATRVSPQGYSLSLDPATSSIVSTPVCTEVQPVAWIPVAAGPEVAGSSLSSLDSFFTVSSIPLGSLVPIGDFQPVDHNCGNLAYIYSNNPSLRDISAKSDSVIKYPLFMAIGGEISLITRPMKLSDAGLFKRVRKAFLRGNFIPQEINLSVYGSRDMRHWYLIGKRSGGSVLFLNPVSSRFLKLKIEGTPSAGSTFEGFSLMV